MAKKYREGLPWTGARVVISGQFGMVMDVHMDARDHTGMGGEAGLAGVKSRTVTMKT
jgi:hypothetical protein